MLSFPYVFIIARVFKFASSRRRVSYNDSNYGIYKNKNNINKDFTICVEGQFREITEKKASGRIKLRRHLIFSAQCRRIAHCRALCFPIKTGMTVSLLFKDSRETWHAWTLTRWRLDGSTTLDTTRIPGVSPKDIAFVSLSTKSREMRSDMYYIMTERQLNAHLSSRCSALTRRKFRERGFCPTSRIFLFN